MNVIDYGQPAFPTESEHQSGNTTWHYQGMTLRDYFAAKAMLGILSGDRPITRDPDPFPVIASAAYKLADAMLKERAK